MASASAVSRPARGARVKLGGTVLALVQLQNRRRIRASVHQLSTNGGLLLLDQPLAEGIPVEVLFHCGDTTVRSKAQMLFPMWATRGCLQPFRFKDIDESMRNGLDAELRALLDANPAALAEDNNIP
jgi:hypothetical protein